MAEASVRATGQLLGWLLGGGVGGAEAAGRRCGWWEEVWVGLRLVAPTISKVLIRC